MFPFNFTAAILVFSITILYTSQETLWLESTQGLIAPLALFPLIAFSKALSNNGTNTLLSLEGATLEIVKFKFPEAAVPTIFFSSEALNAK